MKRSEKRKNIKENSNLDAKKAISDDSLEQVSGGVYRPELRSLGFHEHSLPPRLPRLPRRRPEHSAGIPGRIEPR